MKRTTNVGALIFDMDGTMIDSMRWDARGGHLQHPHPSPTGRPTRHRRRA